MTFKLGNIVQGNGRVLSRNLVAEVIRIDQSGQNIDIRVISKMCKGMWARPDFENKIYQDEPAHFYELLQERETQDEHHSCDVGGGKCPRCGADAYVGFLAVECSMKCSFFTT